LPAKIETNREIQWGIIQKGGDAVPEFVNPFSGKTPERTLTHRELTRAIRLSLSAEEEAVHLYESLADSTDDQFVRDVLQDIANEERVHVGEFQRLLTILLPDEEAFLAEGAREVDEIAAKTKGSMAESEDRGELTVGNLKE
jgi:uncharacterized protein